MTDQPIFEADYVERRSRLTTFFRALLAIPHYIALWLWGMVAALAVVVAWFALLFTGRWPQGLYDFVAGFLRYSTAVSGYVALLTDEYPPFSPDAAGYPVRIRIPPAKAQYDRLKVLLRFLLVIPVYVIAYAMQIVWSVGTFIAWFVIVILGRQPKGLQDMIVLGLSYQQRAYAYMFLLTEDWPPFTDPPAALAAGPQGGSLRSAPATGAPEATGPWTAPGSTPPPAAPGGLTGGDPLDG
ncbi:DUF4389 domain-containing protein [Baekduia soli]|uniref:DUF4389 domain-containing protein n=1 Tax=Baekduia soli TaxID=496014 RepID=A0A5B8U4Y5_9ACTN|nr:DUF4389 domain-containing protein [Baekduia soli]QEC48176.1 DUF4389 domain-containing protein [Baekduia soli]